MEDFAAAPWVLVTIVGAIVLGAVLAYGMWKTRRQSQAQERVTEEATKRIYQREEDERRKDHIPR